MPPQYKRQDRRLAPPTKACDPQSDRQKRDTLRPGPSGTPVPSLSNASVGKCSIIHVDHAILNEQKLPPLGKRSQSVMSNQVAQVSNVMKRSKCIKIVQKSGLRLIGHILHLLVGLAANIDSRHDIDLHHSSTTWTESEEVEKDSAGFLRAPC